MVGRLFFLLNIKMIPFSGDEFVSFSGSKAWKFLNTFDAVWKLAPKRRWQRPPQFQRAEMLWEQKGFHEQWWEHGFFGSVFFKHFVQSVAFQEILCGCVCVFYSFFLYKSMSWFGGEGPTWQLCFQPSGRWLFPLRGFVSFSSRPSIALQRSMWRLKPPCRGSFFSEGCWLGGIRNETPRNKYALHIDPSWVKGFGRRLSFSWLKTKGFIERCDRSQYDTIHITILALASLRCRATNMRINDTKYLNVG